MIRRLYPSVHYTHDFEALYDDMHRMREFAGLTPQTLADWLGQLFPGTLRRRYYTNAEQTEFWPCSDTWRPPETLKVELWRAEDVTRLMVHRHGFCCLVCGNLTDMADRVRQWDFVFERALRPRQSVLTPLLVCQTCASYVRAVIAPRLSERNRLRMVNALIARCLSATPIVPVSQNPTCMPPRLPPSLQMTGGDGHE